MKSNTKRLIVNMSHSDRNIYISASGRGPSYGSARGLESPGDLVQDRECEAELRSQSRYQAELGNERGESPNDQFLTARKIDFKTDCLAV